MWVSKPPWVCPYLKGILAFVNEVLEATCMKPIFKQEIMLGLNGENSASSTNLIILYTKWYLDQAKREVTAPSLPPFAAALLNALSAQFEFGAWFKRESNLMLSG